MTSEVTATVAAASPAIQAAAGKVRVYVQASVSDATSRAYRADWTDFTGWCDGAGVASLPATPETVGAYLADRAGSLAVSTLERRLAAIATVHRAARHQLDTRHPAIRDVMRGVRRVHGAAQRRAAPATVDVVKAMADQCGGSRIGVRDRALLLIGFAGAFRRSELVALRLEHLTETAEGLRVIIPRSKTDQDGQGQVIGIARTGTAHCPVAALQAWLSLVGITEGPVFRSVDRHGKIGDGLSDKAVALVVKRRAEAAGLDPAIFSGHSLRAGLATSAAAAGLEERDIQRQTRHKSVEQLREYIREGSVFRANVSRGVGL